MQKTTTLTLAAALLIAASLPAFATTIDVGFSPEGSAQALVIKTIGSAKHDIHMMAYSFTAPDVMKALIAAKKRGVDVEIVIDENGNRNKASTAAKNLIVNAGIPLRTNHKYRIQHDKVIIVDGDTVETGSFNYSASAEKHNSENAIVIHDDKAVASTYLTHWQSRWAQGQPYQSTY